MTAHPFRLTKCLGYGTLENLNFDLISALENKLMLQAEHRERKYKAEIGLQREIDAESGSATYRNGLLDIVFKLRDKTNKGYRRVSVV